MEDQVWLTPICTEVGHVCPRMRAGESQPARRADRTGRPAGCSMFNAYTYVHNIGGAAPTVRAMIRNIGLEFAITAAREK